MADEISDLLNHQLGFSLALVGLPVLSWTAELERLDCWTASQEEGGQKANSEVRQ